MQKIFLLLLVITLLLTACGGNLSKSTSTPLSTETIAPPITPTVTLTSTPVPSPTPIWLWAGSAAQFNDIVILTNNEVWLAGFTGLIVHWCEGRDCTSQNAAYKVDCAKAIDFTSYYDGWLLTCSGIYHWDGDWKNFEWKLQRPKDEEGALLQDIGLANPNDGWAVGYAARHVETNYRLEAVILHWNGSEWKNVPLLEEIGRNDFRLNAINVVSADDVWVIGDTVLHWNGTKWREVPLPQYIQDLESVSATSATDVWVAGRGFVIHWDGHSWVTTQFDSYVDNVLAISPQNVWVAGAGLYHWNGRQWNDTHYNEGRGNSIEKMVLASDRNIWAVTTAGNVFVLGNWQMEK